MVVSVIKVTTWHSKQQGVGCTKYNGGIRKVPEDVVFKLRSEG